MSRAKQLQALAWLVLSILILQAEAQARTPEEIRILVQGKMRDRHPEHVDEFWNSLGPEALPVLKRMYTEATTPFEKGWLLDGLSHYDDPSIGSLLEGAIPGEKDDVLRRKMLSNLIRSQGENALDFVEPYLRDADPNVRKAVAQGLKQYASGDRAQKRLAEFMKSEKEPWVKTAVEKAQQVPTTLKRADSIYTEKSDSKDPLAPLAEKDWAGEWKGAWITPEKSSAATVQLTLVNEKATEAQQKWRIELKLPRQSKQELKERELELRVSSGVSGHWLELRRKNSDALFVSFRKRKV